MTYCVGVVRMGWLQPGGVGFERSGHLGENQDVMKKLVELLYWKYWIQHIGA